MTSPSTGPTDNTFISGYCAAFSSCAIVFVQMKPAKLLAFKRSIAGPLNTPCTQDAYTAVAPFSC